MVDLLETNLMYLYHNKKDMFDRIQNFLEENEEKQFKIVIEEHKKVNLSCYADNKKIYMYDENGQDINDWLKENENILSGSYDVVMYGLGLTHYLSKLIELNNELNFYIYEPSIDIFVETLKVVDIEQLLLHPKIKHLEVGDDIGTITRFYIYLTTYSELKTIDVYVPYYQDINLLNMRAFYKQGYSLREGKLFAVGFAKRYGSLPYENSIMNIEKMLRSTSIDKLRNKFENCDAIVVGAGPSLEFDVDIIKEHKDKLLIIAAGSSIQSLLYYGIVPHLVVSMDPSEANGRVFDNIDTSKIPLVFMPQINSKILDNEFSRMFYGLFGNDPVTNYLFNSNQVDYTFKPTSSVTGTAIQVAEYLGAKKVIFTGQDLSFPSDNYYTPGATHVEESLLERAITTSDLTVENVLGGMNKTNIAMRSTLKDIEGLILSISDVEFYNASTLGAKIEGAEYKPLKQLMIELDGIKYDYSTINDASRTNEVMTYSIESLTVLLQEKCKRCDELKEINKKSLKIIDNIVRTVRKGPVKAMNMLSKLETEFSHITNDNLFLDIVTSWDRMLTMGYDQQVVKIEEEKTILGKSKLLELILVPYIHGINDALNEIKATFELLLNNIDENKEKLL